MAERDALMSADAATAVGFVVLVIITLNLVLGWHDYRHDARQREERRRAQARDDAAHRAAAAEKAARAFDKRVELFIRRYEHHELYEDPEFLEEYAAQKGRELIQQREKILEEYVTFHDDAAFVAAIQERSPTTYVRYQWRAKVLAIAERLAVKPPPPPAAREIPRPKETREQWRERQLRHLEHRAMTTLARAGKKRQSLEELDALNLDLDEYDQRRTEIDSIFADPDPNEAAHNARTI